MARKRLTVPQEGTQPTTMPTPIDNMINNNQQAPTQKRTRDVRSLMKDFFGNQSNQQSNKRTCTFSIDKEVFSKFKVDCAADMRPMSSVLEEFMRNYHNK